MRILKSYYVVFFFLLYSCIPPTQDAPKDPRSFDPPDTDLLDIGYALPYIADFMYAMEKTKLADLMDDQGPYTIFAPIHSSFDAFKIENRIYHLDQFPVDDMTAILKYHILPGEWDLFAMPEGYFPTLLLEETTGNPVDMYIERDYLFKINGLNIIFQGNNAAINGYLHSVKKILKRPSVLDQLSVNRNLTLIHEILNRNDIDPEIKDMITNEMPDTFFAPSDQAVLSYLDRNTQWTSIDDMPAEAINDLIRSHMVSGENLVLNNIKEDFYLTTMNNDEIGIKIDYPRWTLLKGGKNVANIETRDIQGLNGIIHKIDAVLSF